MCRQRYFWDSEVYARAPADTVTETENSHTMRRTVTSVLWWWVVTAVRANHGVEVQTLVDENYTRYAVFHLGARPGSPVLFQINFGSTAANVLPGSALQHSQTYTIVDESTVTEYVYFEGQEVLVRGEFRVGDAGVLNTGTLNVSFCYRHVYETMWLVLGVGCGDMSRRDRDTGLEAPLRAVYPNITSSLSGGYPMRWEPGRSTCNDSVRVSFQDVFSVNEGCDWPFVDDVALDVEHNVDTNVLSIFQAARGTDDTTAVALIGLLVVFLTTWVYWMRDLHQAVRYSITREYLQGNAVHFGKVVQHALGRETFSEYVQQLWYDTSKTLLEPEYTPHINTMDIQVAASNHMMVWATVSRFSVVIIDVVVLVGTWRFIFGSGGGGGSDTCVFYSLSFVLTCVEWLCVFCRIHDVSREYQPTPQPVPPLHDRDSWRILCTELFVVLGLLFCDRVAAGDHRARGVRVCDRRRISGQPHGHNGHEMVCLWVRAIGPVVNGNAGRIVCAAGGGNGSIIVGVVGAAGRSCHVWVGVSCDGAGAAACRGKPVPAAEMDQPVLRESVQTRYAAGGAAAMDGGGRGHHQHPRAPANHAPPTVHCALCRCHGRGTREHTGRHCRERLDLGDPFVAACPRQSVLEGRGARGDSVDGGGCHHSRLCLFDGKHIFGHHGPSS
jgi:hypothetical protein